MGAVLAQVGDGTEHAPYMGLRHISYNMMDNRVSISNPTKHLMKLVCPRCGDRYNKLLYYSKVRCGKCNLFWNPTQHAPEAHTTAYFSYAVLQRVSTFNKTYIDAPLDQKGTLIEFREMFKNQGSWEVSEIEIVERQNIKTTCKVCGFCNACVTCVKCGTIYEPARTKQRCPKCHAQKNKRTYVPEFQIVYKCKNCNHDMEQQDIEGVQKYVCTNCKSSKIKTVRLCPHCKKPDITPTIIKNKKKCPLCKSDNIEPRKTQKKYEMCIRRLKAFWSNEDNQIRNA